MYVEEFVVRERHRERLRRARESRAAHQVLALRRLERRSARAERALLRTWQRAERLRSLLGPAG
jgi:hypothetical protein